MTEQLPDNQLVGPRRLEDPGRDLGGNDIAASQRNVGYLVLLYEFPDCHGRSGPTGPDYCDHLVAENELLRRGHGLCLIGTVILKDDLKRTTTNAPGRVDAALL